MLLRLLGMSKKEGIKSDTPVHDARYVEGLRDFQIELNDRNSPFMPKLFRDLSELMDDTSRPVVRALKKYTQVNSQMLVSLKMDIAFYLGVVKAIQQVQDAGLEMTQPEILPIEAREMRLSGMYNINLFFQQFHPNLHIHHLEYYDLIAYLRVLLHHSKLFENIFLFSVP